jgi:hypothetical protein
MLAAVSLLFAAAAVAAAPAAGVVRPRLEVRVQLERGVAMSPSDLKGMAEEIRRIWAPVLDMVVVLPGDLARAAAVDSIPLVITARTLETAESSGLGWIAFVDNQPQPQVTVSLTIAGQMLQNGAWRGMPLSARPPVVSHLFLQRALARAAAHEIGHYLLRSRTHTKRGLMRAVFTVDEIMDGRPALNRLEPDAVARLRAATELARREEPDIREGLTDR